MKSIHSVKEAKEWSLKLWQYLVDHPVVIRRDSDKENAAKAIGMPECYGTCPFCEYEASCAACPLHDCDGDPDYDYVHCADEYQEWLAHRNPVPMLERIKQVCVGGEE